MIKKIIYLAVFILFTAISYKYFQSHIFTFHFVDEDENIIAGYYMGKNEKLYRDIFSHKQPLPAVISMVEQKAQNPNSLYLLIKRNREFVYFYSLLWSLIFIVFFGLPGLIFSILFEIAKQYQLGNLFLAESLAVFPAVFVLGHLWKLFYHDKGIKTIETLLFSFSLPLILFLQFTLISFVIGAILILALFKKINKKLFLILNSCFLALFFICFPFVDYLKYFENTLNAIKSIYLGGSAADSPQNVFFYSFLRPFTLLLGMKKSEFGLFSGIFSIGYLVSFLILWLVDKSSRKILVITYLLLSLGSLRIVYPDKTFYSGFPGLPWLGLFVFVTICQICFVFASSRCKRRNLVTYLIFFLFIVFSFFAIHKSLFLIRDYYRQSDRETDWYVNYSRFYDFGQAIKIMSHPKDKLMVLPAEQLIYWQSGLPHASRFLYVYLFVNPLYKQELYNYWEKSPPEFLYDEDKMDLFKKWKNQYTPLRKEDYDTPLYVRNDKLKSLDEITKKELLRLQFNTK